MTGDVGALGFWLMLGMILAAGTVAEALKARDKERERQATLRALLEKDGESVTEVLAYMRERDAAEAAAFERNMWPGGRRRWASAGKGILAVAGVLVGGFLVGLALHYGLLWRGSKSDLIPLTAMIGIWVAGLIVIAWRMWPSAKQKNDPHRHA
jgi:hypothetical protein